MSLAEIIHVHGGRLLNPFPACLAAQNKIVAVQLMQAAGVPTPRSWVAADRNLLRSPVEEQPVIMKPYNGGRGIGIRVMRSSRELTNAPWPAEPVLIQEYIPEYDEVKVYVIGEDVFGIRTHSRSGDARRWPCGISDEVREIALRCGRVFGLGLYGLDVIEGADGRTAGRVFELLVQGVEFYRSAAEDGFVPGLRRRRRSSIPTIERANLRAEGSRPNRLKALTEVRESPESGGAPALCQAARQGAGRRLRYLLPASQASAVSISVRA